ncbi:cAMP-binding domain of CRP or a regulatory subunit of cAMP-dependent protein kinases [Cyclobacterium xiamenense]|uniref:cAMP-binding domain of CRP or a regulatory subunit of cAMP-dependent protein kinases n=1 Tax=Cyclobacterium xiamenense TaxID=1297121 RepID=A0A1H7AY87_9BACT|nr:Crp/Fnr family transcriptional regulator [Cyclobacterium xiamenense]SEJ70563.1 cAMP-binding domain of CRP or a regulatory subunit of cAMP-dependent protein kinases [Cyclobacterium xiamenense]
MKKIEVKKGQILQRKGDVNSKLYRVESGLLRSYSISGKGKEHIYMFAPEDWIIADSVAPDEPCDLFIDAIEPSIVWQEDKAQHLAHDVPKLIKRINVLQKRVIMLMCASALERYEHFLATYPDIVQRVPQKMIASYLGITPEALSTVRRKRTQKA